MGLWASEKTKQNACILFKTYIERKFMKIYDRQTINEMHSFGKVTQERWGGLGGNHDDHITATYWIPYYIQSPYYYGKIVEVNMKELEEDEVILKTEEEIDSERMTLEKMQNLSGLPHQGCVRVIRIALQLLKKHLIIVFSKYSQILYTLAGDKSFYGAGN
jgi:hypothetical protein